jgi:hypothetical protein
VGWHRTSLRIAVCAWLNPWSILVVLQGDTRLEDDWVPDADGRTMEEVEESSRKNEAKNRWGHAAATAAALPWV